MTGHFALVLKSLKDFKHNLIIVVPALLGLGLFSVLVLFVALQLFLGTYLFKGLSLTPGFVLYSAIFLITDVVIVLFISSFYQAAQFGVMTDAVSIGKSSFKRLLKHGKTFFRPMLTFTIAKFIVQFIPAAVLILLTLAAFRASTALGIVTAIIFTILYLIFLIGFSVLTFFTFPILMSKNLSGFKVIVESLKYGKSNPGHIIPAVAVVIGMWLIMTVAYTIVGMPAFLIDLAYNFGLVSGWSYTIIYVVFNVLSSVVAWLGSLVISFFIFNSYFDRNPIKNWK